MTEYGLTPAQTAGPFLHLALPWADGPDVVPDGTPGAILIAGRLVDGAGSAVADALVETWQCDGQGRFDEPGFRGLGRCATDPDGRYGLRTVKPAALPTRDGHVEAPHINVSIFARGLLNHVVTRIYFADETAANAADPTLSTVDEARRHTLMAAPDGAGGYTFDIRLQGDPDSETVFFDV